MSKSLSEIDVKVNCEDLRELCGEVQVALGRFMAALDRSPAHDGSSALRFAVEAGFPRKMFYSVEDTSRYLGVSREVLDAEHEAGRLRYVLPKCNVRGACISVADVDRWIEASTV